MHPTVVIDLTPIFSFARLCVERKESVKGKTSLAEADLVAIAVRRPGAPALFEDHPVARHLFDPLLPEFVERYRMGMMHKDVIGDDQFVIRLGHPSAIVVVFVIAQTIRLIEQSYFIQ